MNRVFRSPFISLYHTSSQLLFFHQSTKDLQSLVLTNDLLKTSFPHSVLLPMSKEEFTTKFGEKVKEADFEEWMKEVEVKSREAESAEAIDRKGKLSLFLYIFKYES